MRAATRSLRPFAFKERLRGGVAFAKNLPGTHRLAGEFGRSFGSIENLPSATQFHEADDALLNLLYGESGDRYEAHLRHLRLALLESEKYETFFTANFDHVDPFQDDHADVVAQSLQG
jgi:hypothetical protein